MQLERMANHFGSVHGSYTKDHVVEVQVQLAEEQSTLAALFYCQMTPMYRELAQRAARRLSASPFIQSATDNKARAARLYLTQTEPNTTECPSFKGNLAVVHRGSIPAGIGVEPVKRPR
ncbi:MAG TPA: hypothetical protein VFY97_00105 [Rhodanobacteraceae bacterium]|nr:hypothetical protein [Rhodanobacteraceae bacterium]